MSVTFQEYNCVKLIEVKTAFDRNTNSLALKFKKFH